MKRILKKQDRNDFESRIKRLDPTFAALPREARSERKPWDVRNANRSVKKDHPILMTAFGFALAAVALFAANRPETVQSSLLAMGWPGDYLNYGMNAVSLSIIVLIIFYLGNLLRIINPRATGRGNAVGLVVGGVAAIGVTSMDPSYIDASYSYVGLEGPGDIMAFAQTQGVRLATIDWSDVMMVSSSPK